MAHDLLAPSPDDQHAFGGTWTRIKLTALEKYLVAFNTALSKHWLINTGLTPMRSASCDAPMAFGVLR